MNVSIFPIKKSEGDTWVEFSEDRGGACYSILGAQRSWEVGCLTPFTREGLLLRVYKCVACSLEAKERVGSFSRHDPIAATHEGRGYSSGKSKSKKGLSRSHQQSQAQRCVGDSGGGHRAASGKAKLVPSCPLETRGGTFLELRRWIFCQNRSLQFLDISCPGRQECSRATKSYFLFCLEGKLAGTWRFPGRISLPFSAVQSLVSTALTCVPDPQTRFFCSQSASYMERGVWQSRLQAFLLAWSQGGPEKLTSEATSLNGIMGLLGSSVASLSFPLQHFQILLLYSSQYLVLFVLFYCHFSLSTPNKCNFSFLFSSSLLLKGSAWMHSPSWGELAHHDWGYK